MRGKAERELAWPQPKYECIILALQYTIASVKSVVTGPKLTKFLSDVEG